MRARFRDLHTGSRCSFTFAMVGNDTLEIDLAPPGNYGVNGPKAVL